MSFVFPTNASQVQAFAGALYGVQVGTTTMAQVNADIAANGGLASTLNSYYSATFGGVATSTVAATVAANLGLTGDALSAGSAYVEAQLNAAAPGARGAVISNILDLFAGLASDATFGAAATAWNAKVNVASAYTGAANVAIGSTTSQGQAFVLTEGVDVLIGTAGNDLFVGRAGLDGDNLGATAEGSDILDGGAGRDTLRVTLYENDDDPGLLPATTNIEVLEVNVNYDDRFTVSAMEGLEEVRMVNNLTDTDRDAELVGFSEIVDAAIINSNQELNMEFNVGAAAGESDEMTLTLDRAVESMGGYRAEIDLQFEEDEVLETLNIISQGRLSNVLNLFVDTALVNLNLSGDTDLEIGYMNDDDDHFDVESIATAVLVSVENITVTGAMNIDLDDVADEFAPFSALVTFDGSVGTGDQEVDAAATTTSMITGSGDDDIESYSDVDGTTTITTNAGDDALSIEDASEVMTISMGAGDDELSFDDDFEFDEGDVDTTSVTADMGAGDDEVEFEQYFGNHFDVEEVEVSIDGGAGIDRLRLTAESASMSIFLSEDGDDESIDNPIFSNFEVLEITDGDSEAVINATNFGVSTVEFDLSDSTEINALFVSDNSRVIFNSETTIETIDVSDEVSNNGAESLTLELSDVEVTIADSLYDFASLTIEANGAEDGPGNSIYIADSEELTNLEISGDSYLWLGAGSYELGDDETLTVDASELTGGLWADFSGPLSADDSLVITLGTGMNVIVGNEDGENTITVTDGESFNVIVGGQEADTITLGEGSINMLIYGEASDYFDIINDGIGGSFGDSRSSGLNIDTVTGFNANDVEGEYSQFDFSFFLDGFTGDVVFLGNARSTIGADTALETLTTIDDDLSLDDGKFDGDLQVVFVENENMLVVDLDGSGDINDGDLVIELVGLVGELSQDNFGTLLT